MAESEWQIIACIFAALIVGLCGFFKVWINTLDTKVTDLQHRAKDIDRFDSRMEWHRDRQSEVNTEVRKRFSEYELRISDLEKQNGSEEKDKDSNPAIDPNIRQLIINR